MEHTQEHWQAIYTHKSDRETSWCQEHAALSKSLIKRTGVPGDAAVIDVGAGTSTLVDGLLADGYCDITLLDVSQAALDRVKPRLTGAEAKVRYLCTDVLNAPLEQKYDLWHDRAVFHFLTAPADQKRYVQLLEASLKPGGFVVMATFADDGPQQCSGLPVARYSTETLADALGPRFAIVESVKQTHTTPFGTEQNFTYCAFKRKQ